MIRPFRLFFLSAFVLPGLCALIACQDPSSPKGVNEINSLAISSDSVQPPDSINPEAGTGYEFSGNGKVSGRPILSAPLTLDTTSELQVTLPSSLWKAMDHHRNYLKRLNGEKQYSLNPISLKASGLVQVLDQLSRLPTDSKINLSDHFQIHQISGEDDRGHIHYTGYYTPILPARRSRNDTFRFPLYRVPGNQPSPGPTRAQIDGDNVLAGKGLEVAWLQDLLQVYFLHVQGSGFVEFEDGERQLMQYGGKNGRKYRSIGKALVESGRIAPDKVSLEALIQHFEEHPGELDSTLFLNPSYTFFSPASGEVKGAISVPLHPGNSIAVDPKNIPLGACLVGEVPVLDKWGRLTGHELRLLFAQDRGAAVNGNGHVDLYFGAGDAMGLAAGHLHHYGRLWLLTPVP